MQNVTAPGRHPLIPPRKVDPHQALPVLEEEVLQRWRERNVFAQSLQIRATAKPWVFYEGPPTANGRPGSHHVLSRVFKDIYPRYKTMRGYRVERKGGWDCHGLPVEIAVERELGISSKTEIEAYGIERFNAKCRESVFAYLDEWNRLTERIGFWIDLDGSTCPACSQPRGLRQRKRGKCESLVHANHCPGCVRRGEHSVECHGSLEELLCPVVFGLRVLAEGIHRREDPWLESQLCDCDQ